MTKMETSGAVATERNRIDVASRTSADSVDTAKSDGFAIRARALGLRYGRDVKALDDVSLEVRKGEHLAILGPSGSGKTSLLGCMSGRLKPTEGNVDSFTRVATIHQDLRLVKQRSALTNVLHGSLGSFSTLRTLFGFPPGEKRKAIDHLNRVGLAHRLHTPVGRLSGGEQQRVAIARALMQDPKILLADEPVASLDEENAYAIMKLLDELRDDRGLTLVSAVHDRRLTEAFADRIIELRHGQLVTTDGSRQTAAASETKLPAASGNGDQATMLESRPQVERPAWMRVPAFAALAISAMVVYVWAFLGLDIAPRQLENAVPGMFGFIRNLFPTALAQLVEIPWPALLSSLVETVQMSLIGTTLGVIISWPLAALAAKNVGPKYLCSSVRVILNMVRTVPSLIWALFFVAAVGFGPLAGVLALSAYSVGYLTKFFYEAFEAVDPGPPSALGEIGASGLQRFRHAVWPAAKPAALSSSLFMLEYNVRAASVLGIVDAGGIGYWIKQFLDYRNFPAALACLTIVLVVVIVLDAVSTRLRSRLVNV